MNKALITLSLAAACVSAALAQSDSTISRAGDLQIGGGYTLAKSDYTQINLTGFNIYATFDFRSHIGIEGGFHQASAHDNTLVYERTYEIGPRVFYTYGRFTPYAKLLVGRGVFNYPPDCRDENTHAQSSCTSPTVDPTTTGSAANLAYNMAALGAGVDVAVTRRINARADFEYQDWFNFDPGSLKPQVFSIGVAYHFGGGPLSTR